MSRRGSRKQVLLDNVFFPRPLGLINHPDSEHYLSLYFKHSLEQELTQLDVSKIPVIGSINQISQILEPIAQGIGFTVLPKSAVDSFYLPKRSKIFKPKQPVIESLYLVCKKQSITCSL